MANTPLPFPKRVLDDAAEDGNPADEAGADRRARRGAAQGQEPSRPAPGYGYGYGYGDGIAGPQGYAGYGGGGGGGGDQIELSLRGLFHLLMRGRWIILGCALAFGLIAVAAVSQMTPLYRASSDLLIGINRTVLAPIQDVVEDMPVDFFTTQTEASVLRSREMAQRTVIALDLIDDPRFNPDLMTPEPSLSQSIGRAIGGWLASIGLGSGEAEEEAPEPDTYEPLGVSELADILLAGLSVEASGNARIVNVSYTSTDPDLAALIANGVAEAYIESQKVERGEATDTANEFLSEQVRIQQQRLLASEAALEALRARLGLEGGQRMSVPLDRLTRLESDLADARGRASEAEARFRQAQLLSRDQGSLETAGSVLDSSLVQTLRVQEVQLVRRVAELSAQLRENHPDMVQARAELADLRDRIREETQRITANLRNEFQLADQRVRSLQTEIATLRASLESMSETQVEMRAAEAEVEANRVLYDTLLQRLRETDVQNARVQQADARIISRAVPPPFPFAPRRGLATIVATMFGVVVGFGIVVILDLLDDGFRSMAQIQRSFSVPALGLIPLLKLKRGQRAHLSAIEDHSAYAEAIRTVRTTLMLSGDEDAPSKSVLVTSSVPGEGKSTMALSMALQSYKSGRPTILIDCDLRRAVIQNYLGVSVDTGLSDYLEGKAKLAEVIRIDDGTGLPYIAAGTRPQHPSDILASAKMRNLLRLLEREFDLVVVDTPPLMAVSDALVLMKEVDSVLFAVRWAKTKRQLVESGVRTTLETGANLAGIVLTQVDVKRHAQYGFSDSGYYYNRAYAKYYTTG